MKRTSIHRIILTLFAVCMAFVFTCYSGFAARSVVSDCINHGDVNLDGSLTAADAQLAFLITLGQYSPTYEEECAADCNGSGSVTSADAQLIFLTVLGTGACEDSLEPQTPTHAPTQTPTPVPTRTPTSLPTMTPYPTYTPYPTQMPTSVPTWTPYPTYTPYPTNTPTPTPTPTNTPTPTLTPTNTPTPTPTNTPTPTLTPTNTPTLTPTNTPTPTHASGDLFATDPIVGNMRFVSAGSFVQGSPDTEPCRFDDEGPQFTHILTRNLAVMETEVSRQMWADLQTVQGSMPNDPSVTSVSPTMDHPVQQSNWYHSVLFANLLSLQNGFTRCYYTDAGFTIPVTASNYTTGPFYCNFNANGYRLPTEGEWEYFARAGTTGPFSCDEPYFNSGNCMSCTQGTHQTLEQYCVYCANNPGGTAVVGSKLPNLWNLKDVHGNVYEWCWDWSAVYPSGMMTDYVGPGSGSSRRFRGGSWCHWASYCRSAIRRGEIPSYADNRLGLRLVRTILPPPPTPGDLFATDPIVENMRFVGAGSFTQGSPDTEPCRWDDEGPQFTHILTKNIAVMETEVSRQMWADLKAVQGTLPNDPSETDTSPTMDHPVQNNSWYESVLFANLLSLQNGFTRCYYTDAEYTMPVTASNYTTGPFYCDFSADGYRLPTEGEWEYFTRAGTSGPFSCDEPDYNSGNCGNCVAGTHPTLEQCCVYCANAPNRTEAVGSKLANPWNLKDVHGNVFERCWDWYAGSYPTGTVTDYVGPGSGYLRVGRGGSWNDNAWSCRSALRLRSTPSYTINNLGFRVVRTVMF